jgi:hypothetical protein
MIGESKLVFAALTGVHFAEVELLRVHGHLTATRGRWSPNTTLPGVLAEFQHRRTGSDTYTKRHCYEDC